MLGWNWNWIDTQVNPSFGRNFRKNRRSVKTIPPRKFSVKTKRRRTVIMKIELFFFCVWKKVAPYCNLSSILCRRHQKNVLTFGQLNKTNRANWVTNEFTRISVFLKSLFRVTKLVLESATSLSEKNVFILGKEFQYLPLYKLKWIWKKNSNFLVISERRRGPTFEIDTPQT